jgi:uncharacterized repeat protein (TIGR03803 family)
MLPFRHITGLRRLALVLSTVFVVTSPSTATRKEVVLYTFTGGSDGGNPSSGLIFDKSGNLYGMTGGGGTNGEGTVFELKRSTHGWTEVVLHSFAADGDGFAPLGNLLMDKAGNLYGTTGAGGTFVFGTVFKLSPSADGWTEQILYNFTGGKDGGGPTGNLIFDKEGNLYGTTSGGGTYGYGVVFKLSPSTKSWTETILHSFAETDKDGGYPTAVVLDGAGNLYGTTTEGGYYSSGTAFQLSRSGAIWKERVIYNFADDSTDGGHPVSGLTIAEGRLFGTTEYGGHNALGTVYDLTISGSHWKERLLDNFTNNGSDGFAPQSVVIFDNNDNLYSTTYGGGKLGYGTVFKLKSKTRQQQILYSFNGSSEGGYLTYGVVLDTKGNLYGTTQCGGSAQDCGGYGVVFELLAPAGQH